MLGFKYCHGTQSPRHVPVRVLSSLALLRSAIPASCGIFRSISFVAQRGRITCAYNMMLTYDAYSLTFGLETQVNGVFYSW